MNGSGFRVFTLVLILCWSGCRFARTTLDASTEEGTTGPISAQAETVERAGSSTTYYIRPDGGTPTECTGVVDAAYPGSGTDQPCAWDHPFRALQPSGEPGVPGTAAIAGGDTLIIGSGSYRMGYGAPGADNCQTDYPQQCVMAPVPSGSDAAHPTRILGEGWDSGCRNPPELWGTERAWLILNLTDASNVDVACLEITDHSDCVEGHTGGLACKRDDYPYGDWAADGLYAEDATNVHLRDLDIHGLASAGVRAGRLMDWTVEDVRIAGNGWVGWEGDIEGDDSNSGILTFRRWVVEWNGCAETYPGGEPTGCWGDSAGGYGDGVGTGATGGDWVIEDSAFLHNTQDGLDLLYHTLGGSITIRRTIAEGNGGNQIKTAGPTQMENVIVVGNCGFFDSKPFTYDVDSCRALGNAIEFHLHPSDQTTVVNSTVTGEGDCLAIAECVEGESCTGSESILLRNDIFQGNPQFGAGVQDSTCLAWTDVSAELFAVDHGIINGIKGMPEPCPPQSLCGAAPGLVDASIDSFDARLLDGSAAIDAGTTEGAPAEDFAGRPRDTQPDIGAYEGWGPTAWSYLPLVTARPSAMCQAEALPQIEARGTPR